MDPFFEVIESPEVVVLPKSQMVQPETPTATKENKGIRMNFLNVVFFMMWEDSKILSSNNKRFEWFVYWNEPKMAKFRMLIFCSRHPNL